jgi:hypothetical protein
VVRYKAVAGFNFISFLPASKMYQVIPNNIQYINSPNKCNRKNDRQPKFFRAAVTYRTGRDSLIIGSSKTLSLTSQAPKWLIDNQPDDI